MEPAQLLRETYDTIDRLYDRICEAGEAISDAGLVTALSTGPVGALASLSQVLKIVEHPEVGQVYYLRFWRNPAAREATAKAKAAVQALPVDLIREIRDSAQAALEADLKTSMGQYATVSKYGSADQIPEPIKDIRNVSAGNRKLVNILLPILQNT